MARLSSHAARGEREQLVRTLHRTLLVVGALLAATAAVYLLRDPLARLAFGNGAMDAQAVAEMSALVPWFVVGLVPTVAGARLIVVGDGRERGRLEALARALGLDDRVQFTGELRDPRPFVWAADAALCSSRHEGLSLALLEAMAQGLPVVAPPVGGVPEFVRDGDTGWLAANGSASALAVAMRAAVAAPPTELAARGARARFEVERRFSRRAMCDAWNALYLELTASHLAASRR